MKFAKPENTLASVLKTVPRIPVETTFVHLLKIQSLVLKTALSRVVEMVSAKLKNKKDSAKIALCSPAEMAFVMIMNQLVPVLLIAQSVHAVILFAS